MEYKKVNQNINNIVNDHVRKLESIFPSAVKDGEVDFEALREELGLFEEVDSEKYELTWSGKKDAKKIAQEDVYGRTLKFIPEDSKDADTTENLYIEGDNLEVLKLLRQNYYGAIKMIYIDPPYNTGNDFVYIDKFRESKNESDIAEGNRSESGEKYVLNASNQNRYHAKWLNMIYSRIKVARDLLADNGVIVISIDDNEIENLRNCCDEVFGEENFINCFIWNCSTAGGIRPKFASKTHEYILAYAKNKNILDMIYAPLSSDAIKMYTQKDENGLYRNKDFVFKNKSTNANQKYGIECPDGEVVFPKEGYIYRFIRSKFEDALSKNMVTFKRTSNGPLVNEKNEQAHWNIYIKKYLGEAMGAPSTLVSKEMMSIYNVGTQCVQELFDGIRVFDNVKPVNVISYFVNMFSSDDDYILDFFSGSATTGHAVMKINIENKTNRKFIMVQLPEICDEKSEAYKAGYKNICEIGKERIRRAGDKIKSENPDADIDIGFKVFKTADTNIKWNSNIDAGQLDVAQMEYTPDLVDFMQNANDVDIVYELMLRQRDIPLSEPLEQLSDIGSRTYLYANSYLVCLETEITEDLVFKLAELDPLPIKFIFRDSAFKDDISLKDETFRRLKALIEKSAGTNKPAYTVEFI